MRNDSVSIIRLLSRDAVTSNGFLALAIMAGLFSCGWVMTPMKSGHMLPLDAAIISCVFFWAWPLVFLLVRYAIAAHRLARFVPVSGQLFSTTPAGRGGNIMQYSYEWQGHVHHGSVGTTHWFSDEHSKVTVLVDPLKPDRSTLKELYC